MQRAKTAIEVIAECRVKAYREFDIMQNTLALARSNPRYSNLMRGDRVALDIITYMNGHTNRGV